MRDHIYQLREYLLPYALCGLTCVQMTHKWRDANHLDYLPIEYVFEEGDEGVGQLSERVREEYGKYPVFRPKIPSKGTKPLKDSDVVVPLTPLQVGDFTAYEVGKVTSILDLESARLCERFRTSFLLIGDISHTWGSLSEEAIRTELNLRKIPRRGATLR
jgi:hypothetical protein